MTYKAVGRSIINYAAHVWSPNLHDTNYIKIQCTQNEALRIATGCHKMSSIDHLHTEAEMLKVKEHSELLSAQYLARCLEPGNVCHPITTRAIPERQMKETLYTRHRNTVEPMMVKNDRKATLQALHTAAVVKAVQCHERNVVLDGRPPPISNSVCDVLYAVLYVCICCFVVCGCAVSRMYVICYGPLTAHLNDLRSF